MVVHLKISLTNSNSKFSTFNSLYMHEKFCDLQFGRVETCCKSLELPGVSELSLHIAQGLVKDTELVVGHKQSLSIRKN